MQTCASCGGLGPAPKGVSRSCDGRRRLLATGALAVALLGAADAGAAPTGAQQRVIEAGVAHHVLDQAVARGLETAEWIRIVAFFAHERGDPPDLYSAAALARIESIGFVRVRRFDRIPAIAGYIDAAGLAALLADPHVVRISLEASVAAQLAEAVPLVNLDDVHALGLTGAGARVAILDTGVDLAHPDLAGAVVAERCFCDDAQPGPAGCCPDGSDSQSGPGAGQDDHGHGTRVAGIVTSAAVHAPLGGAPDAQIVAVKVMDSGGGGYLSDLLAGLDWVLQLQPDVAVVNMSLGFGLYPGHCDAADANTMAVASALDQLHAAGVVSVAGSGNNGSGTGMIAPACVERAISVGAVWDAAVGSQSWFGCTDATTAVDQVTCWSNSSTTTDLFAPGGRMTSSLLGSTRATHAGTSYATPMVSACAAVLVAAYPTATPDEIDAALESSSVSVVDATNGLAFPRLDCLAANASLGAPQVPSHSHGALAPLALLLAFAGVLLQRSLRGRAAESRRRTRSVD